MSERYEVTVGGQIRVDQICVGQIYVGQIYVICGALSARFAGTLNGLRNRHQLEERYEHSDG